ncbi:MAG: TIM barrel protein, partial [Thermomicrobiales bacterium]|nr:TIM barrel protein [Thermomicrobiales bacterium]
AVAYHPHVACTIETEDEIDRLMDQTTALTLCLDASHIALVDEEPIAHIRKYRERTSYIHLKDWARGKFVEMGQGTVGIDFAAIFQELIDHRFGGWVVVEQSRSDVSPLTSAQANAEFVRSLGYSLELPTT